MDRRFRPELRSLYPDTSTLIYALKSRAVRDALEFAAAQGNLLLSFVHLMEFIRGEERGVHLAELVDSLGVVWVHQEEEVQLLEVEHFLREEVRETRRPPPVPAAPSRLATLKRFNVGAMSALLHRPSAVAFVRDAVEQQAILDRLGEVARAGRVTAQRFFVDQKLQERDLQNGTSPTEIKAALTARARGFYKELIREAHVRLVTANHDFVVSRGCLFVPPAVEECIATFPSPADAPTRLPFLFVSSVATRAFALTTGRKGGLMTRFFRPEKRDGDFFDFAHLVGAGYADAFCCDQQTAELLGDARQRIGRSPPVVFQGGDYQRLADDLRRGISL